MNTTNVTAKEEGLSVGYGRRAAAGPQVRLLSEPVESQKGAILRHSEEYCLEYRPIPLKFK